MNYLDYFILGFIIFYGLLGLVKGLFKMALDFIGYIFAFIVAKFLSPILLDYIGTTDFSANIQKKLFDTFNKIIPDLSSSIETIKIPSDLVSLINTEPDINKILNTFPNLAKFLERNIENIAGQNFINVITEYIIMILSIVTIFVLAKIIFSVITSIILSRLDSFPLQFVNRLLGMFLGVVVSVILLSFIFALGEILSLTTSPILANTIMTSKYAHLFTSIPILEILSKFRVK